MSSCDPECICCCLPCIVGWACIYFAYAGVRRVGRYCYGKCHPEPESSGGRMARDQGEKLGTHSLSSPPHRQSYASNQRSHDMTSSVTQIQEPEKAHALDSTIETQPQPIEEMSTNPSNLPRTKEGNFPFGHNAAPSIPMPSPAWSSHGIRSFRRATDVPSTGPQMANQNGEHDDQSPRAGIATLTRGISVEISLPPKP